MIPSEEIPFLKAIQALPRAATPRLVYADWLEEEGDSRSEYLRLELQLAKSPRTGTKANQLRQELLALRPQLDRDWLAEFEQPKMMLANLTPFASWDGVELPGCRECGGTYEVYPYKTLPPLPTSIFQDNFDWLKQVPVQHMDQHIIPKREADRGLQRMRKQADTLGLTLPNAFVEFMTNRDLHKRLRSSTDCFFNWPNKIVESPGGEEGFLLRFYSDSQGCCHWYLYLNRMNYEAVVFSPNWYGNDEEELEYEVEGGSEVEAINYCAPSLEAFIYRNWIENEIWFSLAWDATKAPLTKEQQRYVDHYKKRKAKH